MSMDDCDYFTITSDCYTIQLHMPEPYGESNQINKDLQSFSFWTENYDVRDDGIASQPLVLTGIESYMGVTKRGLCAPLCSPWCTKVILPEFYQYVRHIWEIMDNHEEVTITGLGDCMDAVYVIKSFSIDTIPKFGLNALRWNMTIEKVRDI